MRKVLSPGQALASLDQDAQSKQTKAKNFFTEHDRFLELKLHADALLTKAQMIKDRIKDLEEGNFDEGGMAFEGLDAPLANVSGNA